MGRVKAEMIIAVWQWEGRRLRHRSTHYIARHRQWGPVVVRRLRVLRMVVAREEQGTPADGFGST